MKIPRLQNQSGVELIMLIVMSGVLLSIFTAGFLLINAEKRLTIRSADRERVHAIAEAGINYYRWHLAHSPEDYTDGDDILLDDISRAGYTEAYLDLGSQYYSDATSTLLSIPASLDQALWLRTKQADAADTSDSFLSFWVNRPVIVSIGYDNRGTAPTWLSGSFTDSGQQIQVSDAGASPLRVWQKQFSAGSSVLLGGNLASGASGALSMYTITLTPVDSSGPFIHPYTDFDGNVIGRYSITVTPPSLGSTITTVSSTGYLLSSEKSTRTIIARFGIPSLSEYAVVANDVMRFGEGTETFGKIHSNYGIRFDGLAHGLITSACSTYDDPDHSGPQEDCVHTHQPNPNTVFEGGREFPVAPVDFNGITGDLATLKTAAQEPSGVYLSPSGVQGYHITLKTNGTMDMRRVTSQASCLYRSGSWHAYPDVFSIGNQSNFTYEGGSSLNVPFPANGIIFAEDNIWIDGSIDNAKLTIVAAEEPLASGNANIIVNNDLHYTNEDGTDTIGLIAQNDFHIGFYSEDNLEIDAAIIAQKGRVGRPYYADYGLPNNRYSPNACGDYVHRDTVTLDGSIATNERYGFAYTDDTGYQNRNLYFDDNLIFGPPPLFPTSGEYVMISWEEQ
ncbi:MAG: hypothetical protein H6760_02055 [Candidatus Nomurabacteria bacterium]|nr:MAG: hypothetical protein H6760_02055 [Candidatus Nomurabacteria bacterium]